MRVNYSKGLPFQKILQGFQNGTDLLSTAIDGDGVRDLEAKAERIRNLFAQALQVLRGGKLVVARIHADGWKDLRVFGQALALKPRLREFASRDVMGLVIHLPAPARIFP